ncbi:MAG: 2-iminoacetate synthase ThiH, partial [Candidatus Margulisbacteria bacterium]|nr:2-iminoacetate synthase ThiH [Candidatus Margulisiibacteriota bacterium]
QAVLNKQRLDFNDYLVLLSKTASNMLEDLALKSRELTLKHFGKTILLYIPLYLNNECDNNCVYCGFSQKLSEKRKSLTVDEVLAEAEIIYQKGFRHLLLVAGEKRDKITLVYLKEIISMLHEKFESISLEIFPLEQGEYQELCQAGADGVTIYQEAYNREVYKQVHPCGPKSDYESRLLTPERAARAGLYRINIGALLGLGQWFEQAALLGLHAAYLKKTFWQAQIAVSFPRLQGSAAGFKPIHPVTDQQLVRMICALRIFQPTLGLVLSTRESGALRDNLIPLGITQMSAESKTSPGGYLDETKAQKQFEIADQRSLAEISAAIRQRGYDPVMKDWDKEYIRG